MKSDETINSADHLPGTPSLQYYEAIIARGLPSLENVAAALLELHEQRLYRKSYGSFKEYLRWRWHLSRARGYQMLHFARLKRMSTEVDTGAPLNERQARLLDAQGKLRRLRIWHSDINWPCSNARRANPNPAPPIDCFGLACCAAGHSANRPCSSSNPKPSSLGSALALAYSGAGNPGPAGEDPPSRATSSRGFRAPSRRLGIAAKAPCP